MSRSRFALALLIALIVPCFAQASEAPRYTYIEAGYIDFSPEQGFDDDGAYAEGSLDLFGSFHVVVEYQGVGDYTFWRAGGGWHGLLGEEADLFAEILWNDVEVDTSIGEFDDDGYETAGGIRWSVMPWLEIKAQATRLDLDEAGDDVILEGEGVVMLLDGRVGLGANYAVGDDDTLKAFARISFGK